MDKKRILVLTDDHPWGHRSIAKAIYSYLKEADPKNYEIHYADVKAEVGIANDVYIFLCRYIPSTHRLAYKMASVVASKEAIMREISYRSLPGLQKVVNKFKPDLIISCYFIHSHCLAKWRSEENKSFKLWTLVTDPRSIGPMACVSDADLHITYDSVSSQSVASFCDKGLKTMETGWWVRPEMYHPNLRQKEFQKKLKKKLGFFDERPIVFVGGGSLGTSALTRLLPILLTVKDKVGLILNTGTDKVTYNLVEQYMRLYSKFRKDDTVIVKNMGWIENMAEILSISDIVFGKAGPNFLFDVVACNKPFVAITHVGGQEDGNIELIRRKKLGWVKEKGNSAAEFLLNYLKSPKTYDEKFRKTIDAEAKHNKDSMKKIWERIEKELS